MFGLTMKRLRTLAALWVILVLVAQSPVVVSASCTMMSTMTGSMSAMMSMSDMQGMDHSMHTMSGDRDQGADNTADNCCDDDACSVLNCLSLAMFLSSDQHFDADIVNWVNVYMVFAYLIPELASVNRPPIFR